MRSNLISHSFSSLTWTLGPFFVIQNWNWAMTRVHPCHWSNQRYSLACAYFLLCVDSFARSRSDFVCESRSGPWTGDEFKLSQHAPECGGRRDSCWWQETIAHFTGLQMRVLWWRVWVAGGHGLSSPTPQFNRYTLCRSHELQVHVIDPARRFVHGDSSHTWHPRCVPACIFFGFPVYPVCTFPHPFSCHNEYKVNNGNNIVIIVHNVKQSVLGNPWQKIFYCTLSNFMTALSH